MKTAQRWSKFLLMSLALFFVFSSPAAVQALCRVLYLDSASQQLVLFDLESGATTTVPTYAAPASDVGDQYASVALSPDHRYLAVAANDTHEIVSGQSVGTQIFDLAAATPTLVDTIALHWPVAWSSDGNKLLMRRVTSAAGFYQVYDMRRKTDQPLYQIVAPIAGSAQLNGRAEIFLNITDTLWSRTSSMLLFTANEQPFPQDSNGVNAAIYYSNLTDRATLLTERILNTEIIGWLTDGRILSEQCLNGNCEWSAVQPDGNRREEIRDSFTDRQDVYNRLAPTGDKAVLLTRTAEGDQLNLMHITSRQLTQIGAFASDLPPLLSWSPDGRYFTYSANLNGTITLTLVDTFDNTTRPLEITPPRYGIYADWTPDSTRLLLTGTESLSIYDPSSAQFTQILIDQREVWFSSRWVCN
jgi:WD40 repeat protein